MSDAEVDVLVVGAGPTGLVLSAELARRGVHVRVVDKAALPNDKSRALVVQPRSLELLARMGLADDLVRRGETAMRAEVFVERARAVEVDLGNIGAEGTPYPFVLFVSQADTEAVLDARLRTLGVRVERPVELTSFDADATGVTARLATPAGDETLRARWLIGCDGAHSAVRRGGGFRFDGAPYDRDFILADLTIDWEAPHDRFRVFLGNGAICVAFPLRGDRRYRLIASRRDVDASAGEPTMEEFAKVLEDLAPIPATLHDATWLARFRLHHRAADRYRRGRVVIAGDAAHIHSPAGGQGMNTGMQDAENLAWKLALVVNGNAGEELIDTYEDERLPVGRALLRYTDRLFSLAASRNRLLIALRNFLIPRVVPRAMAKVERRAQAWRFVSQLGVRYPKSPAVYEQPGGPRRAKRPCAGDRAPDAPLARGTTLFPLLRGEGHTLLLFGEEATFAALRGALAPWSKLVASCVLGDALDPGGRAAAAYGFTGDGQALVRPDGVIAFRASGADARGVITYLRRWLRP